MIFWLCLLFLLNMCDVRGNPAFTNHTDCGRLGDQLLNVIKTKYLADKLGVPMVLTPFAYSDCFKFSQLLAPCSSRSFRSVIQIGGGDQDWRRSQPIKNLAQNTLYRISYYYCPPGFRHLCRIDEWDDIAKDENFLAGLSDFMTVTKPYQRIEMPPDRVSVAVHIRKGSGGDYVWFQGRSKKEGKKLQRRAYPEKFSPNSFFRNAIRRLYGILNKPLYVYIFTDHTNPPALVEKIRKTLNDLDIIFACRTEQNSAEGSCIIDDIANIMRFDCLIRSKSNFGQVAELCHDYEVVIYPETTTWLGEKFVVDKEITKFKRR